MNLNVFLHNHPGMERRKQIPPSHVIVDYEDWVKVIRHVSDDGKSFIENYDSNVSKSKKGTVNRYTILKGKKDGSINI